MANKRNTDVPPINVIAQIQARMQPEVRAGSPDAVFSSLPVLLWVDGQPQFMMAPAITDQVGEHTVYTMSPISAGPGDVFVESVDDLNQWVQDMLEVEDE